jgi:hypothetical protein
MAGIAARVAGGDMGGSSHRIEILLVGVVLLLGAAFAAATSVLPQREPAFATVRFDIGRFTVPVLPPLSLPALPDQASLAAGWQAANAVIAAFNQPVAAAAMALILGGLVGVRRGWASRLVRRARALPAWSQVVCASSASGFARIHGATRRRHAAWRTRRLAATRELQHVAPLILDRPALPPQEAPPALVEAAGEPYEAVAELQPGRRPVAPRNEWVPDELAHAAGAVLARVWRALELRSRLVALDVEAGRGRVRASLEAEPADGAALLTLPEKLMAFNPGWTACWRGGALELAASSEHDTANGGPLLAPLLRHGRRKQYRRYLSLGSGEQIVATTGDLGIYGAAALDVLHGCLVSLLYAHPPETLALLVLEANDVSPLYAAAPHAIAPAGSARATLAALDRAVRRGSSRDPVRHLLLVLIEPDATLVADLAALVARTRANPATPLSLLLAQQQPLAAGRELYALLPALLTAGRAGDAPPLAGERWPRAGQGRLITGPTGLDGVPITRSEAEVRAALGLLGPVPAKLPPTMLDAFEHAPRSETQTIAWQAPLRTLPADELAARIEQALDGGPARASVEQVAEGDDTIWPRGPGSMAAADIEALVTRVLSDPSITAATPPGLTKNRLSALLPAGHRAQAAVLMEWFDQASVLLPPRDATLRWREPRLLSECALDVIAARLRATPYPR